MWQAITQQLSETLLFDFQLKEKTKILGGEVNKCYMISDGEQNYFVKINEKNFVTRFENEAENLHIIRNSNTVFVPEVVHIGAAKDGAFLILNYLVTKPLEDEKNSYLFGQQLAQLHLWGEQKEYGYDHDNYIVNTLQPNPWHKKWARFFAEQRIGWQLHLLREKGISLGHIDDIIHSVQRQLANHNPRPCLLHGDLRHTNVANSAFGPICYDPASYWGDHECDIAMTELSGGFSDAFYQGYKSIFPLSSGYSKRKDIYNLYHTLNHCNLYGGHYLEQAIKHVEAILSR